MPPVLRFCLTLAGALLFGWPLAAMLQRMPANAPAPVPAHPAQATAPAVLTVHFTGEPTRLAVYRGAKCIATLPGGETSPWEAEIDLPENARTLELRADGEWPADSGEQAVTLELEPMRQRTREATRWAQQGRMNDIFTFTWL